MLPNASAARVASPDLSELAAAKFVEQYGRNALSIFEQRSELSDQLGHKIAARTWRTMADAAARLLRTRSADTGPPGTALPQAGGRRMR